MMVLLWSVLLLRTSGTVASPCLHAVVPTTLTRGLNETVAMYKHTIDYVYLVQLCVLTQLTIFSAVMCINTLTKLSAIGFINISMTKLSMDTQLRKYIEYIWVYKHTTDNVYCV